MLLAVDVGNSGAKAGLFRGDLLVTATRLPDAAADPAEALRVAWSEIDLVVAVGTGRTALERFLAGPGRGARLLGRDFPVLIPNRYVRPEEAGLDRLADAAGAFALAGGAAVAVDFGSAVTVNAAGPDGAFLGGPIAPGRPAFRAGLAAVAPALPPIPDDPPPEGIPRGTAGALAAGALFGLAGLADRLVSETLAAMAADCAAGPPPRVYVTGGDAPLVHPRMATPAEHAPHLTLFGLVRLWRMAGEGAWT